MKVEDTLEERLEAIDKEMNDLAVLMHSYEWDKATIAAITNKYNKLQGEKVKLSNRISIGFSVLS